MGRKIINVALNELKKGVSLQTGHEFVLVVPGTPDRGRDQTVQQLESGTYTRPELPAGAKPRLLAKEAATPSLFAEFDAAHFETDKAFPLLGTGTVCRAVAQLLAREPGRALLVVGHTDAQGPASHNLSLSDDRALAIVAALNGSVDGWLQFYSAPAGHSLKWGEDQHMVRALLHDGAPYLARDPEDVVNAEVKTASRAFQGVKGQPATGAAADATRRALIRAYLSLAGASIPEGTPLARLACGDRHLRVRTRQEAARIGASRCLRSSRRTSSPRPTTAGPRSIRAAPLTTPGCGARSSCPRRRRRRFARTRSSACAISQW